MQTNAEQARGGIAEALRDAEFLSHVHVHIMGRIPPHEKAKRGKRKPTSPNSMPSR